MLLQNIYKQTTSGLWALIGFFYIWLLEYAIISLLYKKMALNKSWLPLQFCDSENSIYFPPPVQM